MLTLAHWQPEPQRSKIGGPQGAYGENPMNGNEVVEKSFEISKKNTIMLYYMLMKQKMKGCKENLDN